MTEVNPQWQTAPYKVNFCFDMAVIHRPGWSRKRRLKAQRRARKKAIAHYKKLLSEMAGRMQQRIERSVVDRVAVIGASSRILVPAGFFRDPWNPSL